MRTQNSRPVWRKEIHRLISAARLIVASRRIVTLGLIVTTIGIVLGHFGAVPQIHFRWAIIVFIAAGVGVEIFWKCFSAYCVGMARADWMKRRNLLIDACGSLAIAVDRLMELTVGATG